MVSSEAKSSSPLAMAPEVITSLAVPGSPMLAWSGPELPAATTMAMSSLLATKSSARGELPRLTTGMALPQELLWTRGAPRP